MKDLSQLTEAELQAELKRRANQKENDRKAYKELVNETIPKLIEEAKKVSEYLVKAKLNIYKALKDITETKFEIYDVKDDQQSHTFTCENGSGITIGYYVNDNWDDTVNSGISKVNNYIQQLSAKESNADVITIINRLLKKDNKGNLKSSRVLELMGLAEEIGNEEFQDGVRIIRNAYKPIRSKFFIQAFEVGNDGGKVSIPLSITTVEFPNDFDFSFMLPSEHRD